MKRQNTSPFDIKIIKEAALVAFAKFRLGHLAHNPVIFIVAMLSFLLSILLVYDGFTQGIDFFALQITLWIWTTVYFANFAEAMAEGRGKAQASFLKKQKTEISAKKLESLDSKDVKPVLATTLKPGDIVLVEAGDWIPSDGEVIEGVASVDESAITGESAPVIRESGGDRSAVTGGTLVLSDWIKVKITAASGSTFLDRMILLVEGAQRQKTPNEIALTILLVGLSLILLMAVATIPFYASYTHSRIAFVFLAALLVALIPTTIGSLLSAIGIAGMDRLLRFNVLAMSGRAVEAAGDVDTLLLDKTGTITLGNRIAVDIIPISGVQAEDLVDAAQLASLSDETPEGRSIVVLAKKHYGLRGRELQAHGVSFIPFSAHTKMSGVDIDGVPIRKGAVEAVIAFVRENNPALDANAIEEAKAIADHIARQGGTPLAVAKGAHLLGVIHLKDIIKGGIRERFSELRRMGIRTVMITGDNPLTAAAIAAEAGVDNFMAEATPEMKLTLIREEQKKGRLVAMCGDGTNDAPALAQADVGVAMNTGTAAAKEAGNMIDLDSDPTKLIEIVAIGKQLLMTRGALTTFSIANDVAKYFALLPAIFFTFYPGLKALDIMRLASPESAVLSAIIFNAVIIPALVPLAIRGVSYRPESSDRILARNLLYYGLGGLVFPFLGIKGIDLLITAIGLV